MATIAKALALLDHFSEGRPLIGLTEFQRLTGRDKATVHRHLTALAGQGFLEQDPQSRAYRLGPALPRLAAMRARTVREAETVAGPVDAISAETGELTHMSRLNGQELIPIYHTDQTDKAVRVGFEANLILPLLTTSSGKAFLAFGPEGDWDAMIAAQHARFGCPPMPEAAAIRDELRRARTRGYVTSRDTLEVGVSSVGIPVFDGEGRPLGACSVAYPSSRGTPGLVTHCARALARHGPDLTSRLGGRVPAEVALLWQALAQETDERKIA